MVSEPPVPRPALDGDVGADVAVVGAGLTGLATAHELQRRGLDVFGLASLAEQRQAPEGIVELAEQRQRARAERDFAEADRLRAEIEAAGWEARDDAGGYRLVPRA
jgi:cysteinyl-tRNA synthetase